MALLSRDLGDGRALRLYEDRDADELYQLIDANRQHLSRWLAWAITQTRADTVAFIQAGRRQHAENQGFQLAITDGGRIVGGIGHHLVDWRNRFTSLGYWLAADAQGRGTMTQAVRALVDHAFADWQLERVEIRAGVENERSRSVPQRLGFREEGVVRRGELIGERWIDHVVYGLLSDEWPVGRSG
jgi:ribosomal-protein-serine acetyltransferase